MRLLFWYCAVACAIVSASGCNEEFSPKVPGGNRYYLFCIVNATPRGGDVQFAVVDRMYDVEGLNPAQNTVDPFVAGTEIQLTVRGRQYSFPRGVGARLDTSRYTTPVRYYYARGIPIVAFDAVSVQAILPDSTVLSASTVIPGFRPTDSTPQYANGITTLVDPYPLGRKWVLDWENLVSEEHLFFPKLMLTYTITDSTGLSYFYKDVPLKYVEHNGQYLPVYLSYQTTAVLEVEFDALDRFIQGLGEGLADKSSLHLRYFSLRIVEVDQALSQYYSSVNGYMDQFSVRLDERTYTNVRGGDGIVGSSYTSQFTYPVNAKYAKHFGYTVE